MCYNYKSFYRHQHPPFDEDGDQNTRGDNRDTFDVFANPLDMERFFNQQMEAILKNFGINDGFFSKQLTWNTF